MTTIVATPLVLSKILEVPGDQILRINSITKERIEITGEKIIHFPLGIQYDEVHRIYIQGISHFDEISLYISGCGIENIYYDNLNEQDKDNLRQNKIVELPFFFSGRKICEIDKTKETKELYLHRNIFNKDVYVKGLPTPMLSDCYIDIRRNECLGNTPEYINIICDTCLIINNTLKQICCDKFFPGKNERHSIFVNQWNRLHVPLFSTNKIPACVPIYTNKIKICSDKIGIKNVKLFYSTACIFDLDKDVKNFIYNEDEKSNEYILDFTNILTLQKSENINNLTMLGTCQSLDFYIDITFDENKPDIIAEEIAKIRIYTLCSNVITMARHSCSLRWLS